MHKRRAKQSMTIAAVCFIGLACIALLYPDWTYRLSKPGRDLVRPVTNYLRGRKTVEQRLEQYGDQARERFRDDFREAGVAYPPDELRFVGFKESGKLEVYARPSGGEWRDVTRYGVRAASGDLGPKLREGDRQVPEGLYEVTALNPNSSYHLSIKVGYPNDRDRQFAERDGRSDLGGDIFIHGDAASIGCLAMGDEPIEELFVMAADTGIDDVDVVISPVDFRTSELPEKTRERLPDWTEEKYREIRARLSELPAE